MTIHRILRQTILSGSVALAGVFFAAMLGAGAAAPDGVALSSREPIEWVNVWIPHSTDDKLPRVLLVGDSITQAYYPEVEKQLAGKAYVARLTTSAFVADPAILSQLEMVLKHNRFDLIHFNNGMHGWHHSEVAYANAFPAFVDKIRALAPDAKLICATTTPVSRPGQPAEIDPKTERVRTRNASVRTVCEQSHIPVNDLFELVINRPELHNRDGVHYTGEGSKVLGTQVSGEILQRLPANAPAPK